jgi:uncharacterized protein YbjT (DUF2867 family)
MNPSISSPLLFLGAPGLIGNQVIPALINAGFSVLAGSRRGLSVGGAPDVGVDMRDPANLARAMQGVAAVGLVISDGQQARFFCRSAMRGSAISISATWLMQPFLR